jgi:hypothetical protein
VLDNLKSRVFDTLYKFNLEDYAVRARERYSDNFQWTPEINIDEQIKQQRCASTDGKCILFPLFIVSEHMCLRTFSLAHAFQCRGFVPIVLYNYKTLPTEYDSEDRILRKSRYLIEWFSKKFSVKCVSVDDIADKTWTTTEIEDQVNRTAGNGINSREIAISDTALAGTRKSLRRYSLNLDNNTHWEEYIIQMTRGVIIAEATDRITSQYEFDAILSWDVFYPRGKIPLRICQTKGIKSYTQETGYHRGSLVYGNGANRVTSGGFIDQTIVKRSLNNPLSDEERTRIQRLMNKRESGNEKYNFHTANADSTIQPQDDHTVGVFTHLLWDGALEPEQAIYPDFLDWLDDTIKLGKELQGLQFIIKIHPAEEIRETNQKVIDWINAHHPNLPSNFNILHADTNVDTYKLFDILDAGIVYSSTVGLEMSYNNIPVITGGYPPYHGFGITFDPADTNDYKNLVRGIETLTHSEDMTKKARRFAHLLFICKHLDFPYLHEYLSSDEDTVQIQYKDVIEGLSPVVDDVTEGVEVIDPKCDIH